MARPLSVQSETREAVDLARSKRAKKGGGQGDQQNAQSERNNINQRLSPVELSHRMSLPAMPLPDWSPGCAAGIDLDQSCFLRVTTYVFGTLGGAMSFRAELLVLSLLLTVVVPSEGYAVCYCTCTTASGSTCTVSVRILPAVASGIRVVPGQPNRADMIAVARSRVLRAAARCGAAVFAIDPRALTDSRVY